MLTDKFTLPIPCPKCGKKLEKSLRSLQNKSTVTCPCGGRIVIPAGERSKLARMNRSLDGLEKQIKGLGGKLKLR